MENKAKGKETKVEWWEKKSMSSFEYEIMVVGETVKEILRGR